MEQIHRIIIRMHNNNYYCLTSIRFEREVNKWDVSNNDNVVLAKEMCTMMMDMSDFTRYWITNILSG